MIAVVKIDLMGKPDRNNIVDLKRAANKFTNDKKILR
jgi:hypothetical protein